MLLKILVFFGAFGVDVEEDRPTVHVADLKAEPHREA